MTAVEARTRVARGAALLDEKRPGWASRINIATLDIADECACVLGQLEGNFWRAAHALFHELADSGMPQAAAHGCFNERGDDAGNDALIAAWVDAITERLTPPVEWTHRDRQPAVLVEETQ